MSKTPKQQLQRRGLAALLLIAAAALAVGAQAEDSIVQFDGDASALTDEFEIEGPWLLDWHVGSEFPGSFGVEISLLDGVLLSHQGIVLKTRQAGYGTKLFRDSGNFRFRVMSSLGRWSLRVIKITEEQADQMVPIRPYQDTDADD